MERIDEEAVAVFLAGLVEMTPRDMTHRARALAVLVRDAPATPLCPSVRRRSRKRCGGCACSSSRSPSGPT